MWFLLLSCTGAPDSVDSSEIPFCNASFSKVFPEDGSTEVYVKTPIQFYLNQPDPSAFIVTDISGKMSRSEDGRIFSFVPDAPLSPLQTYEISLQGCFGTATTHFRTSNAGQILTEPLEGRSYHLRLKEGRADTQVTELLAPYLVGFVRLNITHQSEHALTMEAEYGLLEDGSDSCHVASQFAVFNEAPHFTTIPTDLPFPHLYQVQFSGTFRADGSAIEGGHITGRWDLRDLDSSGLQTNGTSPEQLCAMMSGVGLPCSFCKDGVQLCVDVSASLIPADELTTVALPTEECTSCGTVQPPGLWSVGFLLFLYRRRKS